MGKRCKFYHGTWEELRAYKASEYVEAQAKGTDQAPKKNNAKKIK
jgi:hypothetical protein